MELRDESGYNLPAILRVMFARNVKGALAKSGLSQFKANLDKPRRYLQGTCYRDVLRQEKW